MNVLIIEDSAAISRIERYAVMRGITGAQVRFAESGAAALALLAGWQPDVVVSDYHLPDTDGFSLFLALRKHLPATPIGFASAERDARVIRRMQAAGAAFFLSMPFSFEELAACVHAAVTPATASA